MGSFAGVYLRKHKAYGFEYLSTEVISTLVPQHDCGEETARAKLQLS